MLPVALTTTGADQLSALSQCAASGAPPGRVSHDAITTSTDAPFGLSQVTYRRPYVGLPGQLSMVIIGLSCSGVSALPALRIGSPTDRGRKAVSPAAMRLTTMRLGRALSSASPVTTAVSRWRPNGTSSSEPTSAQSGRT